MEPRHDLESIFRSEGPGLWRSIMAYSGGRHEIADEAVAEAFARAIGDADRIREVVPWLYRVAFRVAAAEMKREAKEVHDPVPERAYVDEVGEVLGALSRLSPAQRAAVYLHYHADWPVAAVAAVLGMSTAAVKVHLFRGRQRLRRLLQE